jgi:catechol 2,3-dioxygenase-like lactoylglutathione lyase family enzyme
MSQADVPKGELSPLVVERLDHVSIIVTDVDRARAFYTGVLGLPEIPRPKSFDFPGAWFQVGPEVIHLLGTPTPDVKGRRHFCLWVSDVHASARYLEGLGLRVTWDTKYKIDGIDRFFTDDPDGNRVEIQGTERARPS